MNIQFKTHAFNLALGAAALKFPVVGDFIYIEAAATSFELSFDNTNFIPVREGSNIKTSEPYEAFWVRASGSGVSAIAITGGGSIATFGRDGGGGGGGWNPGNATPIMPYGSYAELGNVLTENLTTGVYAVVIVGSPATAETWQLRAWTDGGAPVTDTENGLIVPVDYSGTNKRVWRRAL